MENKQQNPVTINPAQTLPERPRANLGITTRDRVPKNDANKNDLASNPLESKSIGDRQKSMLTTANEAFRLIILFKE